MRFERPEIFEGTSFKNIAQGIAIGFALTLFVGLKWNLLVTTGAAKEMEQRAEKSGTISALASICLYNFRHGAGADEKLVELKKIGYYWDQGTFIEKGGWATSPGAERPNSDVAQACAKLLTTVN